MKTFLILPIILLMDMIVIFDFKKESDISSWRIIDDVVMGGRSNGQFFLNDEEMRFLKVKSP